MNGECSLSNRGFLARDAGYQPANLLSNSMQDRTGSRSTHLRLTEDSVHRELDSIINRVNTLIQFTNGTVNERILEFRSGSDNSQRNKSSDTNLKQESNKSQGFEPELSFSETPASNNTYPSCNSHGLPKSVTKQSTDLQCAESNHTLQSGGNGTEMFSLSTLPARWPKDPVLMQNTQAVNSVPQRSFNHQNLQPSLLQGSMPRVISQTVDGTGTPGNSSITPCFSGLKLATKRQKPDCSKHTTQAHQIESKADKENSITTTQCQAIRAMKMNEVISRLKYVTKTSIGCCQVLVSLLKEVVLADSSVINLLCELGKSVPKALARLQTTTSRADKVLKQLDTQRLDSNMIDDILKQLTDALLGQAKELLDSLLLSQRAKVTGEETISQASVLTKSSRSKSPMSRHPDTRTTNLEKAFDCSAGQQQPPQQHLQSKETLNFAKPAGNRISKPAFPNCFEDMDNGIPQAILLADQKFSFKACSSCRYKKSFVLGFEDGAVSVLSLSDTLPPQIKFDRCFRAGTDAVTHILHFLRESDSQPSRDLLILSVGRRDPVLIFYSLQQEKVLREEKSHSQLVTSLVQAGERLFVSASIDRSIKVWDAETMICVSTQHLHDSPIISGCFSSETCLFASGDLSGQINLLYLETEEGRLKSCCFYKKFKACGPVLELMFDPFKRLVSFEGSRMRVYDCRGTLFKDVRCQYFVSSARFLGNQLILLIDITGRPTVIDYEQSLCDNSLPKPLNSGLTDEIEMASHSISHRITGLLAKGGFVPTSSGNLIVFSVSFDSGALLLHDLALQTHCSS